MTAETCPSCGSDHPGTFRAQTSQVIPEGTAGSDILRCVCEDPYHEVWLAKKTWQATTTPKETRGG